MTTRIAVELGRMAKPAVVARHLGPDRKPRGWSRLGPRRIVGSCVHRMEGTLRGTEEHFLSDDPHGRDALTDYGIGGALDGAGQDLDGVIWEWLSEDDDRSPWASGPADGLEGDGPAFVRAYGVAAINRDLRSIELSGKGETPVTSKQFEALCQLVAYVHDQAGVPWDRFPDHPATGVVTQLQHWEIARKDCPGRVVRDLTHAYQARVRSILKAAQTGQPTSSALPPPPRTPRSEGTIDVAVLAWQFGSTTRTLADGSLERWRPDDPPRRFSFDANGVVSNAWLQRAKLEGLYPRVADWRQFTTASGDATDVVLFANGWTLSRHTPNGPWTWIDEQSTAA